MTDDPNIPPADQGPEGGAPLGRMPVEAPRRASLTLRDENVREARIASMEAANKSLADALRFIYRALLVVLVVLVGVFLLSGYQQVNQAERGIKVAFGAVVDGNLQPGPTFSLPEPLGEIVRVSTAQRSVLIDRAFVPATYRADRPLDQQGLGGQEIDPGRDGSLITGDGQLAHASVAATYRVEDPSAFVRNIHPDEEQALVESVIRRATIIAVASTTIDDLLARGAAREGEAGGRESSLERTIRDAAQRTLDAMDAGVTVDRIALRAVFPPLRIRSDFSKVVEVDARARQARERAEEERRRTLNAVAGSAAEPILDLIDEYGELLAAGRDDEAAEVLDTLYGIFRGEHDGVAVEIRGRAYDEVNFSGQGAQRISAASRNRQRLVSDAARTARLFQEKLAQYRDNPDYFIARETVRALNDFFAHDHVQVFFADNLTLMLNEDPELARELQRAIQRRLTEQTLERQAQGRQLWDEDWDED